MNAQRINEIAIEIDRQIKACLPMNVLMSWGISKKQVTVFNNMPSLAIKVSGFQHKGFVIISLDEGKDSYIIYLLDGNNKIVKTIEEIYCDELHVLDSLIERGEMNDEEYADRIYGEWYNI